MKPQTLFEKLWDRHVVADVDADTALLYIDRHFVYEVTSPQAFESLRSSRREPWRSGSVLATVDHNVPTTARSTGVEDPLARRQIELLTSNCREFGIQHFPLLDERQGIIHVVGPEQGATLPGTTITAGDSHTTTHGAFGTLSFGIGTSDVEHVLATQCLAVKKMKTMLIQIDGTLSSGVVAKDVALEIIRRLGAAGGAGYAVEFAGSTVSALSMEGRMTLCNMAIEAGARVGLIAVDDVTIKYLRGLPFAPTRALIGAAEDYWRTLVSDQGSRYDATVELDATLIRPMVTWGTSPDMVMSIDGVVPDPDNECDPVRRDGMVRALHYMGLTPGVKIQDIYLDKIFIGSCTNARIEDLRMAAAQLRGKRISPNIKLALVVPGSGLVKRQAEHEGLDRIFIEAGFEWREPGCSMCLAMNADRLGPGERCASTSNRNFEGRQGAGGRSHLVSPAMAAAAAVAGHFADITEQGW